MNIRIKLVDNEESFTAESVYEEVLSRNGTMVQYVGEDGSTVGIPLWRVEYVKIPNDDGEG